MGSVGKSLFGGDAKAEQVAYDDMGYNSIYGNSPLDKEWTGLTANQISELSSNINNGKINTNSDLYKSNMKQLENQAGKQASQGMVNLARRGLMSSGGDEQDRMLANVESNLQQGASNLYNQEMQRQIQTQQELMNNYNINFNQQQQQAQMQNQVNQANAQMQNQVNQANAQAVVGGIGSIVNTAKTAATGGIA